jgi:hypothetical protein
MSAFLSASDPRNEDPWQNERCADVLVAHEDRHDRHRMRSVVAID